VSAFLRYTLVGAAATLAHWALLAVLVEACALPAWAASGFGAVLGAQLAFFGNRAWTFAHRGPLAPAWARFMGTAALGALLGMAVVAAGVALGAHYLLAQALATGLVLVTGYALNRRWSFAPRPPPAP
jgi:putative flippase GtrA